LHTSPAPTARYRAAPVPAKAGKLQLIFAKALAHQRAGRLAKALALYRQLLLFKPDLPDVHNNMGAALAGLGKSEEAAAAYCRAIEITPSDAVPHANLGHCLRDLGRFDASEESFRRAIQLKPDNAEAYSGLGAVLMDLERPAEAEAAFKRAIALEPNFAGAYNNLGLALKEAGRLDEAVRAFEQAIRLAPQNTSFYENLGAIRSFCADDHHFRTLQALTSGVSLSPKNRMHLHFALAKAYEDIGSFESAFEESLAGNAIKRRLVAYDEAATLGRMDRTRKLFSADFIGARRGRGHPSPAPIFIIGMPRSGTTLIEQILASHPQVFGAGELHLFEQAIRKVFPGAPSFPEAVAEMSDDDVRGLGELYVSNLRQRAPNAARLADKMPANFVFAGLIHLALPNATIIHAARNPIDTCVSCFRTHFTRGQTQTYDLAELGRHYRHYHDLMAHWRRVLPPGRIIDVHYEELIHDLEGVARRIVVNCGLDWDARCLDFHQTRRTVRTASAAQVRRPIYQSAAGRWRRYAAFLGPLLDEIAPCGSADAAK
jgi:Flp pilus assembly protein TadD